MNLISIIYTIKFELKLKHLKLNNMIENEFKVLMHMGEYVNTNLLENGIYGCAIPVLFDKDETIETLTERMIKIKDMTGASFLSEKYIYNLMQCKMVEVSVNIIPFD